MVALPVLTSLLLGVVVLADDPFDDFMKRFNKAYSDADEQWYRRGVFYENLGWINAENLKGKPYTVGVGKFADLTFEEFRGHYLTGYKPMKNNASVGVFHAPVTFVEPDSIDWVENGAVTPVKNQAQCGSCWSFSTTGALEGAWKIAGHDLVSLSEQNILDCDKGGNKCGGGSMEQAFGWVKENGICSEADDPYKCSDQSSDSCSSSTCAESSGSCTKVLQPGDVTGSTHVDDSVGALEAAVAQQPVSVAIEADKPVFQHYTGGVLTSDQCGENLDHGVLLVGYGSNGGNKFWKIKNSWGSSWGMDGYILIEKGGDQPDGECGVRKDAAFPTIKAASEIVV